MKKIITVLAIGLSFIAATAQQVKDIKVPSAVKSSFAKMFPGIKQATWDKENNLYEASFTDGSYKGSVLFDANGKWTERETAIPVNQLPQKVRAYMQTHYKKEKLLGAAKINKASGVVEYEAEIKGKDVFFTKDGEFIKEG